MTDTYDVASFNDAIRAESERVRNKTDIKHAAASGPHRQQILALKAAYADGLKQVRNDPNLSERGKQQLIARAYTNVSREIEKLSKQDRDINIKRYDEVERKLFGSSANNPEAALSFRDAVDRAAKLDDAQTAMQALGTARMSGDETLARAIVMKAWQAGWSNVTDTYAVENPAVTDQLAELSALRHHLESKVSALGGSVGANMKEPPELRNVMNVAKLAEEELPLTANDIFVGRLNGTVTATQEREFRETETARGED